MPVIEMLVEEDRRVREPARPRNSIPRTRGGQVPDGGHDFVRLAMGETGCSEAVAVTAVRLIIRRHRPQLGRLHGYLARFSPADRAYWVDRARWLDPATAIGELAAGWGLSRSEASDSAAAGRARALAARAFARAERDRVGGLGLLDAELERLRSSSPAAASVIASVGREFAAPLGGELLGLRGGEPVVPRGGESVVPRGSESVVPRGSESVVPRGSESVVPYGSESVVPYGSESVVPHGSESVVPRGSGSAGVSGGER